MSLSGSIGCIGAAPRHGERSAVPFQVTRLALAAVLLTAALLKASWGGSALFASGILESPWFLVLLVEFEIALALWLLSGVAPGRARVVAAAWFIALGVVSASKALAGEENCGCFGDLVAVSPWLTLSFNVAAVVALAAFAPPGLPFERTLPRPVARHRRCWRLAGVGRSGRLASGELASGHDRRRWFGRRRGNDRAGTGRLDWRPLPAPRSH